MMSQYLDKQLLGLLEVSSIESLLCLGKSRLQLPGGQSNRLILCLRDQTSHRQEEYDPDSRENHKMKAPLRYSASDLQLEPYFELLECTYHRSQTIRDVFCQTRDEHDRRGGFLLSILWAC